MLNTHKLLKETYMEKLINLLDGNKTHLSSLGLALVIVLYALGYLDQEKVMVLAGLFGATGLSSLRLAVNKK